jgi:hypothetical protein
MIVVVDLPRMSKSADFSSNADAAALQQQAVNDLLKFKDLQSLLVLQLALYTRQLHKMHGGKPAAASLMTLAPTDASSSSGSRQQRRQRQQQQEQQQQQLVPTLHAQLLEQFDISEQSLAGSQLDVAVARSPLPAHHGVFSAVRAMQRMLDGLSLQPGGAQQNSAPGSADTSIGNSSSSSSTDGSSSKLAWPTEMLSGVLQTVIEAQV